MSASTAFFDNDRAGMEALQQIRKEYDSYPAYTGRFPNLLRMQRPERVFAEAHG